MSSQIPEYTLLYHCRTRNLPSCVITDPWIYPHRTVSLQNSESTLLYHYWTQNLPSCVITDPWIYPHKTVSPLNPGSTLLYPYRTRNLPSCIITIPEYILIGLCLYRTLNLPSCITTEPEIYPPMAWQIPEYTLSMSLIYWSLLVAGSCVYSCQSCFVCSGFTYEIYSMYSHGGSIDNTTSMVQWRWSFYVHIMCGLLSCDSSPVCTKCSYIFTYLCTLADDSKCPWTMSFHSYPLCFPNYWCLNLPPVLSDTWMYLCVSLLIHASMFWHYYKYYIHEYPVCVLLHLWSSLASLLSWIINT